MMYMIFGLGNPGIKYEKSRHNVGFLAVEAIAKAKKVSFDHMEKHGIVASYYEGTQKVLLVKPQTYMNNSGICVRDMVQYYGIPLENILIIYDDIDLDLGQIRIRSKGGSGTHNGMRSILSELDSGNFPRLRLGIGPQPEFWDLADFVLSKMNDAQLEKVKTMCDCAVSCTDIFVNEGIDTAMNRLNVRSKKVKSLRDKEVKEKQHDLSSEHHDAMIEAIQ